MAMGMSPRCHHDGDGPNPHPSGPHVPKLASQWRWGCPQGATTMGMMMSPLSPLQSPCPQGAIMMGVVPVSTLTPHDPKVPP